MRPRGIPADLDADAAEGIARTFLVVRIVRGSLLLVFLAVALVAVLGKGWPGGVALAIALTMLLQAGRVGASVSRYVRSARGRRTQLGH
jgi:hypothetical protein